MHSTGRPPLPPPHSNTMLQQQQQQFSNVQALSMQALAAAAAAAEAGDGPCAPCDPSPPGDAAQYVLLPPTSSVTAVTPAVSMPAATMAVQLQVQDSVSSAGLAQAGTAATADMSEFSSLLFEDPEAVKQLTGQLGLDDAAQEAAVNAARFLK